jgi:1,4-dihydroxy-2-naphthoate octaprenyltransferase
MKPFKGFTWDEKEIPFFQYSEMKNTRARRYLNDLREKPWLSTPWLIIRTFRLPFVIATILPIALGAAVAYRAGFFNWALFALTMLGALLIHLGVNTANDYFDAKSGADDINTTPTPFSGGSRVIQYGLLPPQAVFSLSTIAYLGGGLIGLYLALTQGWPVLLFGLAGLLVSYGYTAPPLRLVYRGLGELAVAIGFGPLLVLGSYFVQARTVGVEPLLASLPVGLLVMLILYVNEIPDRTWDDEASKKTFVTRIREDMIVKGFSISVSTVYGILVAGVALSVFPATVLVGLLTMPLALKIRNRIQSNLGNPYGLMPAMSMNVKLFTYTSTLILVGYIASFFLR